MGQLQSMGEGATIEVPTAMELLAVIALVALVVSHRSLSTRLRALESQQKQALSAVSPHQGSVVASTVESPQASQSSLSVAPRSAPASLPITHPNEPDVFTRFGRWFADDWLMKVGALLFIIGCGWFVSYAFANNWIGPVGRISLGVIAGVLVMAFGYWRMLKYPAQGAVFLALGAGVIILSIFAGRSIYHFFTPASAVGFDFLVAAFVAFASYKFNLRSLAFLGQILAFASPLLAAGQSNSIFLFTYLLGISIASLVLAAITSWRSLILSSLVFVGLYSLPFVYAPHGYHYSAYATDAPIILNFAYLFAMLYLISGMVATVRGKVVDMSTEIILAVCNGGFLFLWIYMVAVKDLQALIFAAWAVVFSVGSFMAFRASSKLEPFYAYGAVAIAFIAAATAAQLSGEALTIAFTIEVCALVALVSTLTHNVKITSGLLLLYVVPVTLAFESMSRYSHADELFTKDFFVLLILAFSLLLSGRLLHTQGVQSSHDRMTLGGTAIVLGTVYIWFLVWTVLHVMIPSEDMATFAALCMYTLIGVWAYFAGLYGSDTARRIYGAGLLVFVVVRLLTIDVWHMALFGRVVTFFAIGILLMATAFLTKRKTSHVV